jgi:hypothetical protein
MRASRPFEKIRSRQSAALSAICQRCRNTFSRGCFRVACPRSARRILLFSARHSQMSPTLGQPALPKRRLFFACCGDRVRLPHRMALQADASSISNFHFRKTRTGPCLLYGRRKAGPTSRSAVREGRPAPSGSRGRSVRRRSGGLLNGLARGFVQYPAEMTQISVRPAL